MIRIEYCAYKNNQEKLLYEVYVTVTEFSIVWPDPVDYFTNNYTPGSEF